MPAIRYLLDTHCLVWVQENNPKIPEKIMDILKDSQYTVLFSQISLFEIGIKQKIGKLPSFYATVEEVYEQAIRDSFTFIPIQNQHITDMAKSLFPTNTVTRLTGY